jgi:hypothetical protein
MFNFDSAFSGTTSCFHSNRVAVTAWLNETYTDFSEVTCEPSTLEYTDIQNYTMTSILVVSYETYYTFYGPAADPTGVPTMFPSMEPTIESSTFPTIVPSAQVPSVVPSTGPLVFRSPTFLPSSVPTMVLSGSPAAEPTVVPSVAPLLTQLPTRLPSTKPTSPTAAPTRVPTLALTDEPTASVPSTTSPTVILDTASKINSFEIVMEAMTVDARKVADDLSN